MFSLDLITTVTWELEVKFELQAGGQANTEIHCKFSKLCPLCHQSDEVQLAYSVSDA